MAGARELGEVHSYPAAAESFDDDGYLLNVNGSDQVQKVPAGGTGVFGVNYVSTEDQDEVVQTLSAGDQLDVVRESAGYEVVADAETYSLGDDVHVSASTAGAVSAVDTGNERVGRVVEAVDHSGGSDGDVKVLIAFNFN